MPSHQESLDKYLEVLKNRVQSYRQCFDLQAFENQAVLRDLSLFCRMFTTTEDPEQKEDPKVLEGRRQVFLRIQEHLQFDHYQLYQLHPLRLTPSAQVAPGTLTSGISKTQMDRNRGEING